MNIVYIHTNEPQLLGAKLAAHSFKTRSANPEAFDVQLIMLDDHPALFNREGQSYLRKGRQAVWHNRDLQSFSPLRFLPPQLNGYEGRAVVVDPDVFAIGDINELFNIDMRGKAILARTTKSSFGQGDGRPFWATSVMLMDCPKLTHWRWEEMIEQMFAQQWDYGNWISLRLEDPDTIGLLAEEWNHLDVLNERTRLLHTTERSTQPWKTGLPVDFDTNYAPPASQPRKKQTFFRRLKGLFKKQEAQQHRSLANQAYYLANPDPRQERFIFTLIRECLDNGTITEAYLKECMDKNYLRHDAFDVLEKLEPFRAEELRQLEMHAS